MIVNMTMEDPFDRKASATLDSKKKIERLLPRARHICPEPDRHVVGGQATGVDSISDYRPFSVNARAAGAAYDTELVLPFYLH